MTTAMGRNIPLYRWSRALQSLMFAQAVWFLYFQTVLTPAEAILLYAAFDISATVFEVPSGYMSDRIGRRKTLLAAAVAGVIGTLMLATGHSFAALAAGQVLLGAARAFASGTDEALLYESLAADGRADTIEREELIAWRWGFAALMISALTGGAMALISPVLPFYATAVALAALLWVTWQFTEPPHSLGTPGPAQTVRSLRAALAQPVLAWLFVLSLLMYGFSHLPYVFGQPFLLEMLTGMGLATSTPLVSGAVSATMMGLSLLASVAAPGLRRGLGLGAVLLLALGMQIGLIAVLALTNAPVVIGFLLLRMVPDALSRPFLVARIQPLLTDDGRATYFSVQSLTGRLLFAASLALASGAAGGVDALSYADIQRILAAYVAVGIAVLAGLWATSRRIGLEP